MRELNQIPDIVLRKCIRAMNESGVAPIGKIVTLKKPDMIKVFAYQIEHVEKGKKWKIPEYAVELYNFIFEDEAEEKIPLRYRYMPKMSPFGSREGTQAYIIDEMFLKGGVTLAEVAQACNTTIRRIKNHMNSVRVKHNKKFVRGSDGRYYIRDRRENEKGKVGRSTTNLFE